MATQEQQQLEKEADRILAEDRKRNSNKDKTILLPRTLERRQEREVYSATGDVADIVDRLREPGIYSRPMSIAQDRKRKKGAD